MIELQTIEMGEDQMQITTISIDIAKNIFHFIGCNLSNKIVVKKAIKRRQLLTYLAQMPNCKLVMEACGTSNYWGREISQLGFQVELIPPQHVKPFLTGNKNDYNDAYAILIASQQAHIRSVPVKTLEQQDSQTIHKVRELAIGQRTALSNQIRGLLLEYGIAITKGIENVRKEVAALLGEERVLTASFKQVLSQLYKLLQVLDESIETYNQQIKEQVKNNEICVNLQSIPGIGPIVASSYFNEVGNGSGYTKGRDVSASLGLVPKQRSTGGKSVLLGISKRGNRYLRCLLIQGAKSVVSRAKYKTDQLSLWINRLVQTRGHNKACVAYANKMARVAWAITVSKEAYQAR
ncbi:transposase [Pseudoalteromonas piscicida]|uniref:Transposase n=5 Tax=Pseudoalteromonas TaxID=53246 RepID=A0ABM6NJT0_PSEO7|nr:transposase [Pseudoalteromonas piscicida]ATD09107.1 transposase [Pseudoalteromonas piscicida]ATD09800.1 transposase [Pseudoalteromonas piscicida]